MSSDVVYPRLRPERQSERPLDLDRVVRLNQPWLLRYFTRRGGRDEAGDLVQEVFLRFARAAERQAFDNPEAYLQRIATNLLRDRTRSAAASHERDHLPYEVDLLASEGDPHETLVARQTLERYEAALMKLKPKTREIFLRHRLDGATYEEIALEWHMSVSGIEKQMMKAIAHIDRALDRS